MTQSTITEAVEKRDSAPAKVTPKQAIRQVLDQNQSAVGASLPSGYSPERFTRLLLTAANTNPALFKCDPRSFLAAGIGAAQLGLEPNDARGLAYLIPYGQKVNLIIGYKGMVDLARRSGMVSSINVFPVFEGDSFTYRLGLDPTLEHVPSDENDDNPDKLTHVYAVAKVQGDPQFVVMTRKQVETVKAQSQGAKSKSSPWHTHYIEMAKKTAIRRLCKMLPQTVEMARAIEHDDTSIDLGDIVGSSIDPDTDDVIDVDPETGEIGAATDA